MIAWAAIFGAVVGWLLSGFEIWGFLLGGLFGLIGGWGFRRAVRIMIASEMAELEARIEARMAALSKRSFPEPMVPLSTEPTRAPAPRDAPATLATVRVTSPEPPIVHESVPPEPVEPDIVAQAIAAGFAAARGWLLGGNAVVRVGLVILFVGLSFLASFAASAGLFPVEFRLALVAAAGIALLVVGFRTRERRPGFGLALQGGGVAAIYLALFGAAKLVEGFPLTAAFALMVLVCALGCALALLQRSQALALTAFAGGFATPLLLSTDGGNLAGLFGYFSILNVAVLFIAGRRSWRVLNLLGFFATFSVASLWMTAGYGPDDFAVTQAFVLASVLIYLAVAGWALASRKGFYVLSHNDA